MKIYQIGKIQEDVRVAIDLNATSGTLPYIGDVDTLSLDEIIRSKIIEAVKRIHCTAPAHILDEGYSFGSQIHWTGDNDTCGWVFLPEEFMRFVVFKMSDWERPVYYPISVDDPEYAKQSSRFHGIRGTPERPVCVVAIKPEGRILEFYSCKNRNATVDRAVYIPYPEIETFTLAEEPDAAITGGTGDTELERKGVRITERCYDAVIYTMAALTLSTLGDSNKSAAMNELAKSLLI